MIPPWTFGGCGGIFGNIQEMEWQKVRPAEYDVLGKTVQRLAELSANFDYCAQECLRAESA